MEKLRLLTYNLHFGGRKDQNLWERMMNDFVPDIVFAQESRHPLEYFTQRRFANLRGCVHQNVPTHQQWGSAIISTKHRLLPVPVTDGDYNGWVVGALAPDIEIGGNVQEVLLVSFHAPSLNSGTYEKHVEMILEQIKFRWPNTPKIIGGDFNLTAALSSSGSKLGENTGGELRILRKLKEEMGVTNAWQHLYPGTELPQTLRWSKDKSIPYHCDAIFLDMKFTPHIAQAEVHKDGEWGLLSDHNPIFVTLS